MSTLSSASTVAEIEAAVLDNVSYEEDGSTAKAKALLTACNAWLVTHPRASGKGGANFQLAPEEVRFIAEQARRWLATNDTTVNAGVIHLEPGDR